MAEKKESKKGADVDRPTELDRLRDRTDQEAIMEANMYTVALQNENMDPETRAAFTIQRLSAEGQVRQSLQQKIAERRLTGGHPRNRR